MGILNWLSEMFGGAGSHEIFADTEINPATGLPMSGGIDTLGNPQGEDFSGYHDHHGATDFHSMHGGGGFDDGWSD